MRHLEDIKLLVKTLQASNNFHALVIESPPGWAKSSTVENILLESGVEFASLGSYSTPLYLYNALCNSSNKLLVIDDCAGLFGEATAMSVLKAASWSSAGSSGERQVKWHSHSDRVLQPSVKFSGKLILLTNTLPAGRDIEAFLSRTLYLKIAFDVDEVENMLTEAAKSKKHYPDTEVALAIVHHLFSNIQRYDLRKLNLRTLKMGYEIATSNPEQWQTLLNRLLPQTSPKELVHTLSQSPLSVEEQSKEFFRMTGLSRRTFFYYRNKDETPHEPHSFAGSANCTSMPSGVSVAPV